MNLSPARLAAAALVVLSIATPAHAGSSSPTVPSTIAPPAGHKVFLVTHAEGAQIYQCSPATGAWTLQAPRAELYAENGKVVGSHFAGPTWLATDGSRVVGRRVDGVNMDPTAIDWLLLAKDVTDPGADGDRLVATTYVQRLNTTGGRAPAAAECDVPGETAEVPYAADYYFWKATEQ